MAQSPESRKERVLLISDNRKARFDFEVVETIEAGLVLLGTEVKGLREHGVQLKDSYVVFRQGALYLQGAHISPYRAASYNNHIPERLRKLLLSAQQIARIERALAEKGLSCIPLKVYFKGRWAKVELGVAKGKKAHDKRDSIKKKDIARELSQVRRGREK